MPSIMRLLSIAPVLFAVAHSQGVILKAQGAKGSVASLPLQVDTTKSDANVINVQEINDNVVNECGRTLLAGNIDIGEQTENQLLNKTVTSVTKGSNVAVTINQVNAAGAGPYTCDIDPTGNSLGSGQTNVTVKETDNADGTISLSLTMPKDLSCTGSSAGNVCTVRCFNTESTGPFGGCFAIQQTDTTASVNDAATIATAQTLEGIMDQIAVNQQDLGKALEANKQATVTEEQGVEAVDLLLGVDSTASATAGAAEMAVVSATATSKASGGKAKATGAATKGNGNNNGNGGGKNGNGNDNRRRAERVFIS